jgi:hypothetical protein
VDAECRHKQIKLLFMLSTHQTIIRWRLIRKGDMTSYLPFPLVSPPRQHFLEGGGGDSAVCNRLIIFQLS